VSDAAEPTAAALVGLLAEEERLRVVAALALGAATLDEVVERSGLDARRATSALERLVAGGLVESEGKGLRLVAERFKAVAQAEAKRRAAGEPAETFEGMSAEDAAVLRNFVSDGRLRQIPVGRAKRRAVLDWLAGRFEPGRTYPERDVNLLLGLAHPDVAALRRYLVDEEFLERRDGFYWRAGGTFPLDEDRQG
jgi:DNA-binding transcriptional ArsR family regulator